jgi:23S rRNA-/tRNA-specific pseudouridylate synthase
MDKVFVVHRLDKFCTGLVVLAKNEEMASVLGKMI